MRSRAVLLVAALVVAGCSGDDGDAGGGVRGGGGDRADGQATPTEPSPSTMTTAAAPDPPEAFGQSPTPVVIGHRGAAGHFPDNTLEGFAGAAALGATWVELDVRLSADGEVFLNHDPTTPDGSVVALTPASDLAAEGLPTLAEALDVIDEHHLGADVEIKSDPTEEGYDPQRSVVDATVALLQARPPAGPVVVTSFDRGAIDRVQELAGDDLPTALIAGGIGDADQLKSELLAAGHEGLVLNHEAADAGTVRTLSTGGLTLWVYTLDDPDRALELVDQGVTGVVTDLPDVISEALA